MWARGVWKRKGGQSGLALSQKKKRVGKRASDGTKDDENSRRRDDRELGGLGFGLLELLFYEFGDVGPGG